ncbi:6156_t:CDS:2, partial [Diversispora eburnea]
MSLSLESSEQRNSQNSDSIDIKNAKVKTTPTSLSITTRTIKNDDFGNLGINSWLIQALKSMSIKIPTEIQVACIPKILEGKDCIGEAKTGSGKTAAFALPILQKLSEDPFGIFALVLTPTRELAFQIADQFKVLGKGINLKDCVIVGGLNMMDQALELSRKPHIVIATPGRLVDHINTDRLLSDTFSEDLEVIFDHIPSKRQTLLFTATMTENILALQDIEKEPGKKPFVYQ